MCSVVCSGVQCTEPFVCTEGRPIGWWWDQQIFSLQGSSRKFLSNKFLHSAEFFSRKYHQYRKFEICVFLQEYLREGRCRCRILVGVQITIGLGLRIKNPQY